MHLAAQYLRVVLLFFSYSDKRFLVSSLPLRLNSRNFSSLILLRYQHSFILPPLSVIPVTQSEHLLFIFSPFVSRICFFPFATTWSCFFFFLFFNNSPKSKFKILTKAETQTTPWRSKTKTLPPRALCKRDILPRIQGGARKLLFALCCNLDSRVQELKVTVLVHGLKKKKENTSLPYLL